MVSQTQTSWESLKPDVLLLCLPCRLVKFVCQVNWNLPVIFSMKDHGWVGDFGYPLVRVEQHVVLGQKVSCFSTSCQSKKGSGREPAHGLLLHVEHVSEVVVGRLKYETLDPRFISPVQPVLKVLYQGMQGHPCSHGVGPHIQGTVSSSLGPQPVKGT